MESPSKEGEKDICVLYSYNRDSSYYAKVERSAGNEFSVFSRIYLQLLSTLSN